MYPLFQILPFAILLAFWSYFDISQNSFNRRVQLSTTEYRRVKLISRN
ncbi:hypothetical protein Nther_1057 [Natranaerobius thermophilus JW/NM-WN-LF]|uniref:Uncharacterized protein n=1 Tax=Natranaerobius thermophilus (strain ATCC BAA-1301 / DSM 18059 / JW/NM-WN-LF) TaxID=457570 RepID=B2A118_NATTJ|nr:hypothetical protein Nther_1057 [Natranaerobius thermophilus JW/NM-WN-LF]